MTDNVYKEISIEELKRLRRLLEDAARPTVTFTSDMEAMRSEADSVRMTNLFGALDLVKKQLNPFTDARVINDR